MSKSIQSGSRETGRRRLLSGVTSFQDTRVFQRPSSFRTCRWRDSKSSASRSLSTWGKPRRPTARDGSSRHRAGRWWRTAPSTLRVASTRRLGSTAPCPESSMTRGGTRTGAAWCLGRARRGTRSGSSSSPTGGPPRAAARVATTCSSPLSRCGRSPSRPRGTWGWRARSSPSTSTFGRTDGWRRRRRFGPTSSRAPTSNPRTPISLKSPSTGPSPSIRTMPSIARSCESWVSGHLADSKRLSSSINTGSPRGVNSYRALRVA
mmetsp:Transcript_28252/g.63080  ORF Transcript_28252/g.63080 Transcript_28252/m.63080 type:complete len:263 (-) Transcript_28252:229-1017(-)